MNIFALIVTLNLNYFAAKPKRTKVLPALVVATALNEYSPLSPPFPKAVKEHPPRLAEVLLVAHAQPQVVTPAKCSSPNNKLPRAQIKRTIECQTCNHIGWSALVGIEGH
jgi:hypothetical protein